MNIPAIAICDDGAGDRQRLRKQIQKHLNLTSGVVIYEYASGEELLAAIRDIRFSLIFLDIQMDKMDGDETARKIRELDDSVLLVFYTGYSEPSPQCFEVQPYRYIMKNMSDEEMDRYIKASLIKMNAVKDMPVLEAKINGRKLFLKPDDIVYIEKYKKTTKVHISDCAKNLLHLNAGSDEELEIRISDKLKNLYGFLKNYGFGYPHDSYIINFKYLTACRTDNFSMAGVSDKTFTITRSKAQEFHSKKSSFLTMKYVDEEST